MSIAATQTAASARAVLLGLPTPLSGVQLPSNGADSAVAIVTVQHGTLIADTSPGAVIRGAGSSLLMIGGTIGQINAKLATLSYVGNTLGADTLTISSLGSVGQVTTTTRAPLAILPFLDPAATPDDVITIDHGTLTIEGRTLDGASIMLIDRDASPSAPAAILINTTVTARSTLSVLDQTSGDASPRLAIAGRVELDGTTRLAGATVSLAQGATLFNEGSMAIDAAALFAGTGTLINDGAIRIGGNAPVRIDPAIGGTGTVTLASGASLWLNAGFATGGTITLPAGANVLHLAVPGSFAGTIAGFDHTDAIVLDGTTATNAIFSAQADAGTGTLSLFDGARLIGNLRFTAPEPGAVFQLDTDPAGNTVIRLAAVLPSADASNLDVFRFFDATHGTQLLTQSAAERDAIIAGRPDLHFEGSAFKAVAPGQADANGISVFRFFDTSNGTHFLTSNLAERDGLLATRPDMIFEPNSTVTEHATAQAGDVAVYRFFDQNSGAHFFTANAGERATILATRPDMMAEGIAFYAPTA